MTEKNPSAAGPVSCRRWRLAWIAIGVLAAAALAALGLWLRDFRLGDFRQAEPMELPSKAFTATYVSGPAVIVGGQDADGKALDRWEVFDPGSMTFTKRGRLSRPRTDHAAVALGSEVLVIGGWDGERYVGECEIINPGTGQVRAGPKLRFPRRRPAVRQYGSRVLIGGGAEEECGFEMHDGDTREMTYWEAPGQTLKDALLTYAYHDLLLFAGGRDKEGRASNLAWLVDMKARTTEPVGPMKEARFGHAVIDMSLWGPPILLVGGTGADGKALSTTEIFDAQQRTFQYGPRLLWPVASPAVAPYRSISVSLTQVLSWIVVGGTADRPSATTQVFDGNLTGANAFVRGPRLGTALATTQALWVWPAPGRDTVAVVGGEKKSGRATAAVEVLDTASYEARKGWFKRFKQRLRGWLHL